MWGEAFSDCAAKRDTELPPLDIQELYLAGKKDEAAALPRELLERISLIGPEGHIRERLAAFKEAGVTTVTITPLAETRAERTRLVERARVLADEA